MVGEPAMIVRKLDIRTAGKQRLRERHVAALGGDHERRLIEEVAEIGTVLDYLAQHFLEVPALVGRVVAPHEVGARLDEPHLPLFGECERAARGFEPHRSKPRDPRRLVVHDRVFVELLPRFVRDRSEERRVGKECRL